MSASGENGPTPHAESEQSLESAVTYFRAGEYAKSEAILRGLTERADDNADRQLASLLSKSAATGYRPAIETALQRCFDSPRVDMPLETWPPPVREVVEMTLLEPLIEQSIKPAIDTLGSLTDAISICGANSTDPTPDSSRGTFCGVKSFDDTAAIRPNFRCPDREIQCIEFHVNQHTDTMNLV